MTQEWTYAARRHGSTRTEPLELGWEVLGDPISDSYTPDEISAHDLFDLWAQRYGSESNGLLRIYWSVYPVMETAPLQSTTTPGDNFHTYWEDPVDSVTGLPINWLAIPVLDKRWTTDAGDKGGFIQQATGWKPSALQPYVTFEALRAAALATR